jgi:hypothetical protein
MTKTNATYKISKVKPLPKEEAFDPKAQKANGADDAYNASSPDAYKDLIKGNFKAEPINGGVLGEMAEASSKPSRRKNDHYSQMQDLIGTLVVGEARTPAQDTVGNIPYVPDLEKDILDGTTLHEHMEPVVERYGALEKVLITMYDNLRIALHPNNSYRMSSSEIRSMNAYREALEEALRDCRFQLAKAHDLLRKQKNADKIDYVDLMPIDGLEIRES